MILNMVTFSKIKYIILVIVLSLSNMILRNYLKIMYVEIMVKCG